MDDVLLVISATIINLGIFYFICYYACKSAILGLAKGIEPGWFKADGKKYYKDNDLKVPYSCLKEIEGALYVFDDDGAVCKEGLVHIGDKTAYAYADGLAAIGWKMVDNKKYYFDEDGYAACGIVEVQGKEYYFNCNNYQLMNNVNYYGLTTKENGQVAQINESKAIEDILTNDSVSLNKFKDIYGDIKFEFNGADNIKNAIKKHIQSDIHNEDIKIMKDEVFIFSICPTQDDKKIYFVSIKDGKIYIVVTKAKSFTHLQEISDNEIIDEYIISEN